MQQSMMSKKLSCKQSAASVRSLVARPSRAASFRPCLPSSSSGDYGSKILIIGFTQSSKGSCHVDRTRAVRANANKVTEKDGSSSARQMLGMKGASDETNVWKIRVQLTKPVTWIPLIWGEPLSRALGALQGELQAERCALEC